MTDAMIVSDDESVPTFEQRLAAARHARLEALAEWRCGGGLTLSGGAPIIYMCHGHPRCDGPAPGYGACRNCYSFYVTDARSTEQIVRDMEGWMRT